MPARRLTREQLAEQFARFEREHGLSSSEFYARFRSGEAGDSPEVISWGGRCYMALRCGLLEASPTNT